MRVWRDIVGHRHRPSRANCASRHQTSHNLDSDCWTGPCPYNWQIYCCETPNLCSQYFQPSLLCNNMIPSLLPPSHQGRDTTLLWPPLPCSGVGAIRPAHVELFWPFQKLSSRAQLEPTPLVAFLGSLPLSAVILLQHLLRIRQCFTGLNKA